MSSAEAEDLNRTNPKPRTGPRTNNGSPRSEIRPSRSQADLRSNRANRAPRARCAGPMAQPYCLVTLPEVLAEGTPWALKGFPLFDQLLTLTCKSSKRTMLVPGHSMYSAEDWAAVVARQLLLSDWGLPKAFNSDRDRRFHSAFWRGLWRASGTKIFMTTGYY